MGGTSRDPHRGHCGLGHSQYKYTTNVSASMVAGSRQYMEVFLPSELCVRTRFSLVRARLTLRECKDDGEPLALLLSSHQVSGS